jgi:sortase A
MWRVVRFLGLTMIWSGVLIFLFLAYELWGTDLLASRSQAVAEEELSFYFDSTRSSAPPETPSTTAAPQTTSTTPLPELLAEQPVAEGEPFARIVIPKIEVEEVVFQGVDRSTLKQGPGHMPWTPLPGQPGNAVISGHRTTYGRPFYDLDLLEPGDRIEVETSLGVHVYEVREIMIVKPTDVWVTEEKPGAWLTLTTCNPRFSAAERLIVQASLVEGPNLDYVLSIQGEAVGDAA